jgi:transposase-like protein
MNKTEETVLVCPHCLGTDLKIVGGWMGQKYLCRKCGYQGALILEMDAEDVSG